MLYITTRDNRDANTAYKTLHNQFGPDGGAFLPFRMPLFTDEEIEAFVNGGFSETVAAILNRFFSCKITSWDVDFCIGRNAVKITQMPHRLAVAELWHNPKGTYESAIMELYHKITEGSTNKLTEWFCVATRIAILFGLYTQMRQDGIVDSDDVFDISLPSDDFDIPVAALYAKEMGLPIDVIICTGEESSGVWDFIHLGELNTTLIDGNYAGFERYVYAKLGAEDVIHFMDALRNRRTFRIAEDRLCDFNHKIFCATAGKNRGEQTINSVFRSNNYIMDPDSARCVGGLQDYRAKAGESRLTLVLSEISPLLKSKEIAAATGISADKLSNYI